MHDVFCTHENSGHITTGLLEIAWAERLGEILFKKSKNDIVLRRFTKLHSLEREGYTKEKIELETNKELL